MLSTSRLVTGFFFFLWASPVVADNWPQWRGPNANGVSSEEDLPTRWSAVDNIAWKAPLDGLGTSTPVVWGDQVFLTTQLGAGPIDHRGAQFPGAPLARDYRRNDAEVRFVVYAFDRTNGQLRWRYEFTAEGDLPAVHYKHSLASPSCVTDGESVYAWVGTGQLVALNMEGELLWQRHLGRDYAPFDILWGHGSTSVLHENLLYLLCDHPARAYLLALDKRTGKEIWRVERGTGLRSYSTPLVLKGAAGDELVVNSSHRLESFDPKTGTLLWYAGEPTTLAIPMPVSHGGILYASRGYASGPYASIRGGGRGDVSASHVRWSVPTGAPYVSSLLYYEGLVYMANEHGIVTAIDAESGGIVWRERLGGVFTASPVAGDGKIYLLEEGGRTVVLEAGRTFRILAENALGERSLASPAVSGGQIFIRTDRHLYCIGESARRGARAIAWAWPRCQYGCNGKVGAALRIVHWRESRAAVATAILLVALPLALRGQGRQSRTGDQESFSETVPYRGHFAFTRIRYGAGMEEWGFRWGGARWAHDYPRADQHLSRIISELTSIEVHEGGTNVFDLDDPDLFKHPIAYVSEPGFWTMSDKQAQNVRSYLLRGGFLIFDDFENEQWDNFEAQIMRALPEYRLIELDISHPIFHSFFDLKTIDFPHPLVPVSPSYFGIFEDNDPSKRMMVIVNYNNDVAEYWEWSDRAYFPIDITNEAYKLGVNYVVYAMTH